MGKPMSEEVRRVLAGSMTCEECNGRGEVSMGERHGFAEFDLCPVCRGNTVVPIWKDTSMPETTDCPAGKEPCPEPMQCEMRGCLRLDPPLQSAEQRAANRRQQAMWDEVDWP
jgi:hypothetical protein